MAATASLFDIQQPLPGIPPAARSDSHLSLVGAECSDGAATAPIPGQLRLGDKQIELQPILPSPVQLGMLPEPPPWELPDPKSLRNLSDPPRRHRSRPALIQGQLDFF